MHKKKIRYGQLGISLLTSNKPNITKCELLLIMLHFIFFMHRDFFWIPLESIQRTISGTRTIG